jgi:hypothetical protein
VGAFEAIRRESMTDEDLDDAEDQAENDILAEYSAGGCLGLVVFLLTLPAILIKIIALIR